MCGLVGMLTTGKTSDDEMRLFKGLLLIDQLRGEHATGVFKVDLAKNEVSSIKRAWNAVDFLADSEVKEFLDKDRVNLYVGHNRYATMGDKSAHENAHPFQQDHITMVHNGGVDQWGLDLLEGYDAPNVVVDSHMVCKTIAKHGVKTAVTEKLSGAFALIWWDSKERTLNFIRNQDRPLWFAVTQAGALVWASEKAFLDVFLERQGKTSRYRSKPIELPANELNTFKFTDAGYRIGQGPVATDMEFLEISYPKYSSAAGRTWWESNATYTPTTRSSQSASEKSTVELDNIMRINKEFEQVGCRHRYGSVISGKVVSFEPYATNKVYGNMVIECLATKTQFRAWGVRADAITDVKYVRGTVSNAYGHVINGKREVTFVLDKVGISCHDPKYVPGQLPNFPTSHGDLESARRVQEKIDQMEREAALIEQQKKAERERNNKPRLRITNQIDYPLKVNGHTFQSAAEFREFVSRGCACCGRIPEAYNEKNKSLSVYQGDNFTGLLDECEFICGKCGEV